MRPRPFVSVRFSPAGRTRTFLLPDLDLDAMDTPIAPGEQVVVQTEAGPAVGTARQPIPGLDDRKPSSPDAQVVRRASAADILTRLKNEQREQEAKSEPQRQQRVGYRLLCGRRHPVPP